MLHRKIQNVIYFYSKRGIENEGLFLFIFFKRHKETSVSFSLSLHNLKRHHNTSQPFESKLAYRAKYLICLPSSLISSTFHPPRSRFHSWVKFSPLGNVMVFYRNVSPEMQHLLVPAIQTSIVIKSLHRR